MNEQIYVVYCYYTLFDHTLPRRKWVKVKNRKAARDFVDKKVNGRRDRFLWSYVVNGVEVETI